MARRFEQRSRVAPMDFSYDSPDSDRAGAVWSPFKEALAQSRSQTQQSKPPTPPAPSSPFKPSPSVAGPFGFGASSSNPSPFSFQAPDHWAPPSTFSPQKAFAPLPSSDADAADISMSTAGSTTPDASPSTSRIRPSNSETAAAGPSSPLRRSTFKSRDRDRSRERERERVRRRGLIRYKSVNSDESDADDDDRRVAVPDQFHLHMPTPRLSHGELPYVLSGYLQFFFNLSLLLAFLYCAVLVILTVQSDVEEKVSEYASSTLREIAHCTKLYLDNKCDPVHRIPHMEATCTEWEECMNRDPTVVGRSRVAAETFAQVVNSFVEEISWKTLAFTLVSLAFFIVFTNTVLSLYRSKHAPSHVVPTPAAPTPQIVTPFSNVQWSSGPWQGPNSPPLLIPESPRRRKTSSAR